MSPEAHEALAMAQRLHAATPALNGFCAFPTALRIQHPAPHPIPAGNKFETDPDLSADGLHADFLAALRAFAPQAMWRETYKGTVLGPDFLKNFGCYELIGKDGPFRADTMRGFIVYMPRGIWYPYHRHPSQELYYVLAGDADFYVRDDCQRLGPGDKAFHRSNIPHALETTDSPILAWVLWRGPDMGTTPELCDWNAA